MLIKKTIWSLLFLITPILALSQTEKFNADSAYSYIEHLSVKIGPRPMGTINEQIALQWATEKFKSFGADTAYILVMKHYKKGRRAFNTNSGIAVGIFNGNTDSSIVVGGHIDSATPEIQGANDDASGTAAVLELARIWSKRDRHYTLVFTAFGGEESGLVGSNYFVDHYENIDKVHLMLQNDMTASDDQIMTLLDSDSSQTPIWLVKDAFELDRSLGINRLIYPAHFSTLNNLGQGAGSDHQPFLMKHIPAIDFTAGINNSPIHTHQDNMDFVDKEMVRKCGLLVDGLISKYQLEGIPTGKSRGYELWEFLGVLLFVPPLFVKIFIFVSIVLGVWAFIHSRKNRLIIPKKERVRFSGWKLFLMMIIIAIFTQLGEAFIQMFKGVRYPWFIHINKYLFFAAIWSILGIWLSLQITRKWKFSPDSYVYTKRALIFLFISVIITILGSERLAVYPASALFLFSLAILIPNSVIKTILLIISPILVFKLMFMEAFALLAHTTTLTGLSIDNFVDSFLYSALITVILILWYIPFIYSFSYGIISVDRIKSFFKVLRRPVSGLILLVLILGVGGYLLTLSSYNKMWRPAIQVNAEYDINKEEHKLSIAGSEFLKNVQVSSDSINKTYEGNIVREELPITFKADWLKMKGDETIKKGEKDTINIDWFLTSDHNWMNATLTIEVDSAEITDVKSDLAFNHDNNQITFPWTGDLPDTINMSVTFTVEPETKLIRYVTANYTEMPIPIKVISDLADVTYRTKVTCKDTLDFQIKPE